jgi:hypothetical protein
MDLSPEQRRRFTEFAAAYRADEDEALQRVRDFVAAYSRQVGGEPDATINIDGSPLTLSLLDLRLLVEMAPPRSRR